MNRSASPPLHIRRASPDDRVAALELVFGHLSPDNRDQHVAQAMSEAEQQPDAVLWAGYRGERLVAAMLAQVQAGRTAFVSPPRLTRDEPLETVRDLAARLMDDLVSHGVQLAQALLDTDHGEDAERLAEIRFRHVANLLYLVSLAGSFPTSPPKDGLEFAPYSLAEHDRLAAVVQRTYEASLDCPEIEKARSLEDVLAGYRATGVFDPARWLIATHQGVDIGCVLLTDHPKSKQWELIYMGVVREARGRGWGVALARHAQWLARQAGRERLVLAVDAANAPAIDVYAAAGFVAWDHRSVFLRSF
jgi:ribosomal protein S18 acetylase RimI-like enzyme